MKTLVLITIAALLPTIASAMQSRVLSVQSKAFTSPTTDGLNQVLDLKKRQVVFQTQDFDKCGQAMLRTKNTLQFECKMTLPTNSVYNKLRTQISATTLSVRFGGSEKAVAVSMNAAASEVMFSTKFDSSGIDFEMVNFNDEILKVYSKVAQMVFAQAMQQNPLVYEVYETTKDTQLIAQPQQSQPQQVHVHVNNYQTPSQVVKKTKHKRAKRALKDFVGL